MNDSLLLNFESYFSINLYILFSFWDIYIYFCLYIFIYYLFCRLLQFLFLLIHIPSVLISAFILFLFANYYHRMLFNKLVYLNLYFRHFCLIIFGLVISPKRSKLVQLFCFLCCSRFTFCHCSLLGWKKNIYLSH